MKFLTMQLQLAGRKGVYVVEHGEHLCTLYPHAWAHMVDRAELAFVTGTSYSFMVERACAHCLVSRAEWLANRHSLAWWRDRRRCRCQMLLLVDVQATLEDNKLRGMLQSFQCW